MRLGKHAVPIAAYVFALALCCLILCGTASAQYGGVETGSPSATPATTYSQGAPSSSSQGAPSSSVPPSDTEGISTPSPSGQQGAGGETEVVTDVTKPLEEEEKVYLNVQDAPIKDVIKQISKATGRNFIMDESKVKGNVTIISEKPLTREEAYQTFLSALQVAGYTTVKGPANVIKIIPISEAVTSPIPTHVDTTPYTDNYITRLIPLQNISARDMADAIKGLVKKPGTIDVYDQTNTLIITDTGVNINRLMKIVKELDQEGPQQIMEIIPIRNARATDIAQMVNDLFEREKQTAARGRGAPPPSEEMKEVRRIIADERTNSIVVIASKRAIEAVREIIARLDAKLRPEDEGNFHVYYLKYASAEEMEKVLSGICSSAGASAKGGGQGATPMTAPCSVKADKGTNSLIIQALPKDFTTLMDKVISQLDIPRQQVYFEAVVMELAVTRGTEYGVSGYGGAALGGSIVGMGQALGAPALLGSILGATKSQGASAWPAFLGGLISSRTSNITYVGADGSTQTLTIPAFSAFLSALASRGEANVISTPNLLTLDNETATMKVQTKEPTPGSTTFGAQGIATATSVSYEEAGLELEITPQITHGDMIKLHIKQKLSDFTAPKFSSNLQAPAKKERQVETYVVTENGQTVVMAGLMEDSERKNKTKIPLLGDIPIIGMFFSKTDISAAKNNLLIFITPYIVKDATDFSAILKRKVEERNRFIDANFSKSKAQEIRDTIKIHREDLLEFKEGGAAGTASTSEVAPPKTEPPLVREPMKVSPSKEETSSPVITVPPVEGAKRGTYGIVKFAPPEESIVKTKEEEGEGAKKKKKPKKTIEEEAGEELKKMKGGKTLETPPASAETPPSKAESSSTTGRTGATAKAESKPSAKGGATPGEDIQIQSDTGKVYNKPEVKSRNGEIDLAY